MLEVMRIIGMMTVTLAADVLFVNLPHVSDIPMQGSIDFSAQVNSVVECGALCYESYNCDAFYYHLTTRLCTGVFHQIENISSSGDFLGTLYRTKESKECVPAKYKYIWELNRCFMFYGPRKSNEDARSVCENEDADLITVNSALKESLFLPYVYIYEEESGRNRFWIGLNDQENEGNFTWPSGEKVEYSNWKDGEPNNENNDALKQEADCVQYFIWQKIQAYAWYDVTCEIILPYICESRTIV